MIENKSTLLLDTLYILPLLGLQVPQLKDYEEKFPKMLIKFRILFNPLSLVEAKWVLLKLMKSRDIPHKNTILERFRIGIKTILKSERLHQTEFTSYEIEKYADTLLGVINDYFDRMIIATAKVCNAVLLTEDRALMNIPKKIEIFSELEITTWNKTIISI